MTLKAVVLAIIVGIPLAKVAEAQAQDTAKAALSDMSKCPSARGYSAMVYDESSGIAYLFGGIDKTSPKFDYPLFDLWTYRPLTQKWQLLLNADTLYNAFQRDATAIDPQSKQILLLPTFVNCTAGSAESCGVESWIYDIRLNTFTNVTSGTEPSLRWGSRMAYDAESRRGILFGGSDGRTMRTICDTWAFDFATKTWTRMSPAVSPPPHHFAALVYHPKADRVISFGGYNIQDSAVLNDTWAYDYNTNTWTDMNPHTAPPPRIYHAMAWDSASNRVILFGGVSRLYEPVLEDTWAYDYEQNTWSELTPEVHPSARAWHVMVSTPPGVLLFGGSSKHDPSTYNDTWIYDSERDQWKAISPCKNTSEEEGPKR